MDLLFSPPEPWRVKAVEPVRLVPRERDEIRGLRAVEIPDQLPHFLAAFEPAEEV